MYIYIACDQLLINLYSKSDFTAMKTVPTHTPPVNTQAPVLLETSEQIQLSALLLWLGIVTRISVSEKRSNCKPKTFDWA